MKRTFSILMLGAMLTFELAAAEPHTDGHNINKESPQMIDDHDMTDTHNEMQGSMHTSLSGKPGDPAKVTQTIEISMDDSMRFTPDQISVKVGSTIRFFVKNNGKLTHEMVIGTMEELKGHGEMMREMPDMKHIDSNMIRLTPGQRGSLLWQFDRPGVVDFACLVPGHFEAGMAGKVKTDDE